MVAFISVVLLGVAEVLIASWEKVRWSARLPKQANQDPETQCRRRILPKHVRLCAREASERCLYWVQLRTPRGWPLLRLPIEVDAEPGIVVRASCIRLRCNTKKSDRRAETCVTAGSKPLSGWAGRRSSTLSESIIVAFAEGPWEFQTRPP